MLSSSKFHEVFATFRFCYSRNKKQVTVYKLVLTEIRINPVSSQAFCDISLCSERDFCSHGQTKPKKAIAWSEQKRDHLLLQIWHHYLSPWDEMKLQYLLTPQRSELSGSYFTWGPNGHIYERLFSQDYILFTCTGMTKSNHSCIHDGRCLVPNTGMQYNITTSVNSNWNPLFEQPR